MMRINRRCFCLVSACLFCRSAVADTSTNPHPSCVPSFDATNGTPILKIDYRTVTPMGGVRDDPSGDYDFENALVPALFGMADFLGLNFAFGYYSDTTIPNAAFDDN